MQWIGIKRVAFIPTHQPNAQPVEAIPDKWDDAILARVLHDLTGPAAADISLRAWLLAASSGLADIEPVILPMRILDHPDASASVFDGDLGTSLRDQGVDHAVVVTLEKGAPTVTDRFWSRLSMSDDAATWVKQIVRGVTGFRDLARVPGVDPDYLSDMGMFDVMAGAHAPVHPSAYTKRALGWIAPDAIMRHRDAVGEYDLQFTELRTPPAYGRAAAMQVRDKTPYMLIEARTRNGVQSPGGPGWAVIWYTVHTNSDTGARERDGLPLVLGSTITSEGSDKRMIGGSLSVVRRIPGGVRIRIEMPPEIIVDRSANVDAPKAEGEPVAIVVPSTSTEYLVYRDIKKRLITLWRSPQGSGAEDVSTPPGATAAAGDPSAFLDQTSGGVTLVYRATDDHVHAVYWSTGAAGHDDLTASAGAPPAEGDPVGWMTPSGTNHVAYRAADGHVIVLWWSGAGAAAFEDLTAASGVRAQGSLAAYFDAPRANNVVVFRATDGHVRSLYWGGGGVASDDWSGIAGMPDAGTDPAAYWAEADDTQNVVYGSADGRLIHLCSTANGTVVGRDISALSGVPVPTSRPAAAFDPHLPGHRVAYAGVHGNLHEATWRTSTAPPIRSGFGGLDMGGTPALWVSPETHIAHVAYRAGFGGGIHEIRSTVDPA